MDIHKPKPWHGGRELAKEIGTIVIGVLIAIAFEQSVEWLHWRHKLSDAEAAVRFELHDDDLPQAYARVVVRACLDKQLANLTTALITDQPREVISRLAQAYAPPARTWDMDAWHTMVSSDAISRLTAEEAGRLSGPYHVVPVLADENAREIRDGVDLRALDPKPGALNPPERDRVVLSVQRLRADNSNMFKGSNTLLQAGQEAGVTLTAEDKARVMAELRPAWGDCLVEPKVTFPSLSSQAPLRLP